MIRRVKPGQDRSNLTKPSQDSNSTTGNTMVVTKSPKKVTNIIILSSTSQNCHYHKIVILDISTAVNCYMITVTSAKTPKNILPMIKSYLIIFPWSSELFGLECSSPFSTIISLESDIKLNHFSQNTIFRQFLAFY